MSSPRDDGPGPKGREHWPSYATREHPPLNRRLIRAIEQLTGRPWLGKRYERALESGDPGGFFGRILEELEIDIALPPGHIERVPREGAVLMVANHPFGLVDGLALCDLAHRTRGRFKILLHMGLLSDPRLEPYMLPVDMTGDSEAMKINRRSVAQATIELRQGGTVLIFPAGGIATRVGLRGPAEDLRWHPMVGRLFRGLGPTVVPVHFAGQNSDVFHTVSVFSMTLRASVLLSEMRRMRRKTVDMKVGHPLEWNPEAYADLDDEHITGVLREAVLDAGRDES